MAGMAEGQEQRRGNDPGTIDQVEGMVSGALTDAQVNVTPTQWNRMCRYLGAFVRRNGAPFVNR